MKNSLLIITLLISSISFAQTKVSVVAGAGIFTSANVVVNVGDTVEWTSAGFHNVNGTQATFSSNPASFGNSPASGWTYFFVFTVAGVYNYQCDVHAPNMAGTVTVQTPVGINENANVGKVGFYPNPASKELNFSNIKSIKHVGVYALTGEKILESNLIKEQLDISTLSSGIYFVKITTNTETTTEKLIIQ